VRPFSPTGIVPWRESTKPRYALVSPVRTFFRNFPSPVCVHKVSQVGAEQARIELQVVILERLGTADNLAAHLAQVSQVDQVQRQVVRGPSGLAGRLSKLVPISS
jgi:hypothetical protein